MRKLAHMRELTGRLKSLDPEIAESLQAIAFFDALVEGHASVESIVRGAAVLSGVTAGAVVGLRQFRIDPSGKRSAPGDDGANVSDEPWPEVEISDGVRVWLERHGAAHANDAVILERYALAVSAVIGSSREAPSSPVETLIDSSRTGGGRAIAAQKLGLDTRSPIAVIATPTASRVATGVADAVVAAFGGPLRVTLAHSVPPTLDGRAGIAWADGPSQVATAWIDAQISIRLSDEHRPVVHASELGALIVMARAYDSTVPLHPDTRALVDLDPRSLQILDELATHDSVRAAAVPLNLHHSSLQSRHEHLTRQLGYDPVSPTGRPRYAAARLLARMHAITHRVE
jgi:hypothetical protein